MKKIERAKERFVENMLFLPWLFFAFIMFSGAITKDTCMGMIKAK